MSFLNRLLGTPDIGLIPFPRHSIEGLTARWVQWGAATNYDCSPIADETGTCANAEQPEDVWFLAGCFGGTVNRTCTIPANKKIFFPVFNIWTEERLQSSDLSNAFGHLKIDGKEIELDRVYTNKPFVVKGVWGNPVTDSVFGKKLYVGGLWKLIEPLAPGEHEIYFRGGDGFGFTLEVIYKLTVFPK